MCSYGSLHMGELVLADEQELIYINSVRTQDVIWKTCQEDGVRESGKFALLARLDDYDTSYFVESEFNIYFQKNIRKN